MNKQCKANWTSWDHIVYYYLAQLLRYENAVSVRSSPSKISVVNCFPSFLMTWITSSSKICVTSSRLNFFKYWQLSAIRRTVLPLNPCWKENISLALTKRVLTVVFFTGHYTYNCIQLMHNKEVFCTYFPVCLLNLQNYWMDFDEIW